MSTRFFKPAVVPFAGLLLASLFQGCSDGSDGAPGEPGPPGPSVINMSTVSDSVLAELDVVSEITAVSIASPPVVTFTLATSAGVPIIGMVPFWEDSSRYVRFTITKLVPGEGTLPDSWVAYVRDEGQPNYDTGASLVDNEDGSYTFTFNTDVTMVEGVDYDPTLTHRVAGQVGSNSVSLEPQNMWLDFVPDGSDVTLTRDIAVMETCNTCHDNLVFHGRRFEVQYCVQCHNPDLAEGEGNMSFMIHRIHAAGSFEILDDAISYEEVTYPQDVNNCRKCHNGDIEATPQGDNWMNVPSIAACSGCHEELADGHGGGASCVTCHNDTIAPSIETAHLTPNATPNNPMLPEGQRNISYELIEATIGGDNDLTIKFQIFDGETPLDVTNLPADLAAPGRFPGFLLAWAEAQQGIDEPADWNNLGNAAAQPTSVSLGDFGPINVTDPIGTIAFDPVEGIHTATITDADSKFPPGAMMRAVGLQGYFQQDLGNDETASLHALSEVVSVTGDDERREIIDVASCANCHEWFEGHGGNRVFGIDTDGNVSDNICTMCHVPNLSSSGRTLDLAHPEDAQNLKDMIHGIHSADFRTRDYEHVRNFRDSARIYNWSEVTFPRGASTSNCALCHDGDSYQLPLADNVLDTTVRTTGVASGQDPAPGDVITARETLPNGTDWVNSPTSSSCFYCHTGTDAFVHMWQNGAQLSVPDGFSVTLRDSSLDGLSESCSVCHGPGRSADLDVVHNR